MIFKRIKVHIIWFSVIVALMMPFSKAMAEPPEELITMNFEDADIRILIKFISELVNKNFIIDDKIKGKVTIISPEKITIPEAYRVFESILEIKGFTLVPTGKVIKVVPANEAKQRGIQTDTGKTILPSDRTDQFVTRITRLDYVDANEIITLVRPLFSKEGHVVPYKQTNTLIMTDLKTNLYRILKIINELDVKGYHAELYVIPLKHASVKTMSDHLTKILEGGSVSTSRAPVRKGRAPARPGGATGGGSGIASSAKIISDERTNSLIVLATRNDYETIISLVRKLDVEAPEGQGRVNIYYLQNAVAEEIVTVLNEFVTGIKADAGTGGAKGAVRLPTQTDIKIVADKATNSLIINAEPEDYEQLKSVIGKLDIPRSQVLIEALIMEVLGSDSLSLGVEWQTFGGTVGTDDSIDRLGFGGSLTNQQGNLLPGLISSINAEELPGLPSGFNLGIFGNFIEFNGQKFPSISALITAVATRSDTNIVATPQILTMDNEEAEIKVVENRPFLTQARTGDQGVNDVFQSFDFKDVGVTLKVTPHISQNRFVRMAIYQEISNVNEQATEGTGATAPVTTKRSADTTVQVKDGHTIVIGGLIQDDHTQSTSKVPCLGDLPYIKHLFSSNRNSNVKTNLMIFLTPHIVTNPLEAAQISESKHEELESRRYLGDYEPEFDFYGSPLDFEDSNEDKEFTPDAVIIEPPAVPGTSVPEEKIDSGDPLEKASQNQGTEEIQEPEAKADPLRVPKIIRHEILYEGGKR